MSTIQKGREKVYHAFEPDIDESQSPSKILKLAQMDQQQLTQTLKEIKMARKKKLNDEFYRTASSIYKIQTQKKHNGMP